MSDKITDPLDVAAATIYTRNPAFLRGVMMASIDHRPLLIALISLDIELWSASRASQEELVNAIKLAWWRGAISVLPEGAEKHPVLGALIAADAPLDVAMQMVEAYAENRESLPIMMRAMAEHLGADADEINQLIHAVGDKSHQPRSWPLEARPLVAMLVPMTKWQTFMFKLRGRA